LGLATTSRVVQRTARLEFIWGAPADDSSRLVATPADVVNDNAPARRDAASCRHKTAQRGPCVEEPYPADKQEALV